MPTIITRLSGVRLSSWRRLRQQRIRDVLLGYVMVVAVYIYCLVCVFLPASLFLHLLAMHHGTRSFSLSREVIV